VVDTPVLRMFRTRFLYAPWWVFGAMTGLPLALTAGVLVGLRYGDLLFAVLCGLLAGLVTGLVTGIVAAKTNERIRAAVGPIPPEHVAAVMRAAHRGPVPQDPAVREAALRMAVHQLTETSRFYRSAVLGFGFFAVFDAFAAVVTGAWHLWLGALLFAFFAVAPPVQRRRLERRVAVLRGEPRPDPGSPG
jgi:hypothetical protein